MSAVFFLYSLKNDIRLHDAFLSNHLICKLIND